MPLKMFQPDPKPLSPLSKITHIIGIAAGKGGVGKSSVTVNLAIALKLAGYAVGILDADIYGPSVRRMLPEETMPRQKGEKLLPADSKGIKIISMAYFRKEHEAAAVRAPIANGVITQFLKNVDWGLLDFLLIDFPPGTGDIQLTLTQQANLTGTVIVTTPQEVALLDVRKAAHLFSQMNVPIIGVVENMSYYQSHSMAEKVHLFGSGGGERLAMDLGVPFLGGIPIDPEICRCGDAGESIFQDDSKGSVAISAYKNLTKAFVAHVVDLDRAVREGLNTFEITWKELS